MASETTFPALFLDGKTAASHTVRVQVQQEGITITGHGASRRWKIADLTIEQSLQDGLAGEFSHKAHPDQQLIVEDKEGYRALRKQIREVQGVRIVWKLPLMVVTILAILVLSVSFAIPYFAASFAPHIPKSLSAKLGKAVFAQYIAGKKSCKNPAGQQALEDMLRHLQPASTVNVAVIQRGQSNAVAMPGGYVVIHSGLISSAKSADEVAGVLAHELGHVHYHHSMEHILRAFGNGLVIDMLTGGGGGFIAAGSYLLETSFSREKERQADDYAVRLLHERGVSSAGLAAFFSRGDVHENKKPPSRWVPYVSTHPDRQDRIKAIQQWKAPDVKTYAPILSDEQWQALRQICSKS